MRSASAPDLLVGIGFPPGDIIFDPNIFAVATGIEEHMTSALISSRAVKGNQGVLCQCAYLRARLSNCLSFPQQRACAARAGIFLPIRIPARTPTWRSVNAGTSSTMFMTRSIPAHRLRRNVVLNRERGRRKRLCYNAEEVPRNGTPPPKEPPNGAAGRSEEKRIERNALVKIRRACDRGSTEARLAIAAATDRSRASGPA